MVEKNFKKKKSERLDQMIKNAGHVGDHCGSSSAVVAEVVVGCILGRLSSLARGGTPHQ